MIVEVEGLIGTEDERYGPFLFYFIELSIRICGLVIVAKIFPGRDDTNQGVQGNDQPEGKIEPQILRSERARTVQVSDQALLADVRVDLLNKIMLL